MPEYTDLQIIKDEVLSIANEAEIQNEKGLPLNTTPIPPKDDTPISDNPDSTQNNTSGDDLLNDILDDFKDEISLEDDIDSIADETNNTDRRHVYDAITNYIKKVGYEYIKAGLTGKGVVLLERLIRMKLTIEDKKEVKEKLLELYDKLGKRKEYDFLKEMDIEKI